MDEFKIVPIGVVHTRAAPDDFRTYRGDRPSEIEIFEKFQDGLEGLQGFSHVYVLGYFDKLRPEQIGPLRVKPRRMLREGLTIDELPTLGVFALDSPTRPNPISLSLARLNKVEGRVLHVADLDLFDGSPVIDIKPYHPQYGTTEFTRPEWHTRLHALIDERKNQKRP